jgi:hypothetical protein
MDEEYMKCSCGSGEYKYPLRDGYGIFLTYACEKCEEEKMSGYRSDINEQYECNEPIEPEDPSDLR